MVGQGYVRNIGLSEVGSENIRKATSVHSICDLQIEYSLLSHRVEHSILKTARELGIAITAYGVLSRGLLSGRWRKDADRAEGDLRARLPRFLDQNVDHSLVLVQELEPILPG